MVLEQVLDQLDHAPRAACRCRAVASARKARSGACSGKRRLPAGEHLERLLVAAEVAQRAAEPEVGAREQLAGGPQLDRRGVAPARPRPRGRRPSSALASANCTRGSRGSVRDSARKCSIACSCMPASEQHVRRRRSRSRARRRGIAAPPAAARDSARNSRTPRPRPRTVVVATVTEDARARSAAPPRAARAPRSTGTTASRVAVHQQDRPVELAHAGRGCRTDRSTMKPGTPRRSRHARDAGERGLEQRARPAWRCACERAGGAAAERAPVARRSASDPPPAARSPSRRRRASPRVIERSDGAPPERP